MWIAEFSESSNLWTHLALPGIPGSTPVRVSRNLSSFGWPFCLSISLGCWALPCPLLGRLALKALADPHVALVLLSVIMHLIAEDTFQGGQSSFGLLSKPGFADYWICVPLFQLWPRIRWDYPLNLSISISGGKETNKDSPSNGEWSGKSSNLKSGNLWLPEL